MTYGFPRDTTVSFTQNSMESFSVSNLHQYMLQEKVTLRTNSSNYRMHKNKKEVKWERKKIGSNSDMHA